MSDERVQIGCYFLQGEAGAFTSVIKAADLLTGSESMEIRTRRQTQRGGIRVAQRVVNPVKLWQFYERSAAHSRCCDVKANDIVGGEWTLDKDLSQPIRDSIGEMLDRSAEDLEKAAKEWEIVGFIGLECEPARNGRDLFQLHSIGSDTLWRAMDQSCIVHSRDGKNVKFSPLGVQVPGLHQMAWLNNNHWIDNSFYGVPDALSVLLQIETAWEALQYNRDYFIRRGGYRYMLLISLRDGATMDSPTSVTQDKLIREVNLYFQKVGKEGNSDLVTIPLGSLNAELVRLEGDLKDLNFGQLLHTFRDEVLMRHGVPPIRAGIVETGSLGGNVGQEQLRSYAESVVRPKQRRWNRLINTILKVWYGVDTKFAFSPLEIDDFALLMPHVVNGLNSGLMYRDECRQKLALEPVDDGEKVWGDSVERADNAGGLFGPDGNPTDQARAKA